MGLKMRDVRHLIRDGKVLGFQFVCVCLVWNLQLGGGLCVGGVVDNIKERSHKSNYIMRINYGNV